MGQIVIVYYSETGNTEAMANMVAKGVEAAGATAKVVPVVSKITGDADVQTQKVAGTNEVIIKTKTLDVEQRQQLEDAMHEKPSLIMLLSARQETSRLLGEDVEERQARQMVMQRQKEQRLVPQNQSKKKEHWER